MNILIFTHNYPVSKTERRNAGIFVHEMASELAKTNRVSVVCPAGFNKKVKFGSVTVYFFSWGRNKHLGKLKFYQPVDLLYALNLIFQGIRTLSQVVHKTKPDLTLAMWATPGGLFAYFTKARFGTHYAVWVLGSDFYIYTKLPVIGLLVKYVLKRADYLFADGLSLAKSVSQTIGRNCHFLPSSTNFRLYSKAGIQRGEQDKIVLTFIGRMESIKGPDVLVDSLLKLGVKAENFRINFLGDGSLLETLKKKVSGSAIAGLTKFFGNVDDEKMIAGVLADTHWLVIPSRSDSIPLVFSEAMKSGVPVIASKLEDLTYFIGKYKVGVCFEPGDSQALFAVLERLPSLERQRLEYIKNTGRVAKLFSLKTSAQSFLQMVQDGQVN